MPPFNEWPVGIIRSATVSPAYDLPALVRSVQALTDGCSPSLLLLLKQSGLAHAISSEHYFDGQSAGHEGGNAIDALGVGGTLHRTQMRALAKLLRSIPSVFACVAYTDIADPSNSLFVWDGAVADPADIDGAPDFVAQCTEHVHLSSSRARMLSALATGPARTILTVPVGGVGAPRQINKRPFPIPIPAVISSSPRVKS